jgi:hypothetical protein
MCGYCIDLGVPQIVASDAGFLATQEDFYRI